MRLNTMLRLGGLALLFASVLLTSPRSFAADDPRAPPREKETVFSLTVKGGWLMIPIGICSIIVLTYGIERTISLRKVRIGSPMVLDQIFADIPQRSRLTKESLHAALTRCDADDSILGRVLKPGVEKLHRDEPHVQTFLEESAAKEVHLLKRRLRPFSVSASLAPLLGLLGTIFGMISCFENASAVDAASRAESLARGIYEALVTTAAGLCVAIPAMALFYYFSGRVDRAADLIDETATRFLDHYFGVPAIGKVAKHASAHGSAEVEKTHSHGSEAPAAAGVGKGE